MSGRMALRLNSSVKSGFVKKLTIMSATPSVHADLALDHCIFARDRRDEQARSHT